MKIQTKIIGTPSDQVTKWPSEKHLSLLAAWRRGYLVTILCFSVSLHLCFFASVCVADEPVIIKTELTVDDIVEEETPKPTIKPSIYHPG